MLLDLIRSVLGPRLTHLEVRSMRERGRVGDGRSSWKDESGHQTWPSYQSGANHSFSFKTQLAPASG